RHTRCYRDWSSDVCSSDLEEDFSPATRAYLGSDRFQREVLLAAQLSHPHIVPLFEADEADGLLFYVMEYVEGESLQDRISRKGQIGRASCRERVEMWVGGR